MLTAGVLLAWLGGTAAAQTPEDGPQPPARQGRRGALPPGGPRAPMANDEIFGMLDAFVMARAQAALQLDDARYGQFFQRMLRLQEIQRQHRRQRQRLLADLRQLAGPGAPASGGDDAIAAKLGELDQLDARIGPEERRALGEIDQVLGLRQRARFRLFLENMERQKIELLMRVRQGARGGDAPPQPVR
jgi:hypothetical protein